MIAWQVIGTISDGKAQVKEATVGLDKDDPTVSAWEERQLERWNQIKCSVPSYPIVVLSRVGQREISLDHWVNSMQFRISETLIMSFNDDTIGGDFE